MFKTNVLTIISIATLLLAAKKITIHNSDGTAYTQAISAIDSITFEEIKTDTVGTIEFVVQGENSTFTNSNGLTWNITRAAMLLGDMGIHCDHLNTSAVSSSTLIFLRRNLNGEIIPVISGYFAVNLLSTTPIQQISVEQAHYDHIQMAMLPETSISTNDSVIGIANYPELKTNSLFISGTVSNGKATLPFELHNDITYGENDLGDILIDLSIYKDDHYSIYVHPDFAGWFDNVKWAHFDVADTVIISQESSTIAFMNIEGEFKADNSMTYTVKKN